MPPIEFREAKPSDFSRLMEIRMSVKENTLSDPALIPLGDYHEYIVNRGKGWVAMLNGIIRGFAIADLKSDNVWALFVEPGFEKKGIGSALQQLMLDWYFAQDKTFIWLSTSPGTRAESFYRRSGWRENGTYGKGEIRFEMTRSEWMKMHG